MNKFVIVSINFKYDDGQETKYTTVDVHFNTVDVPFSFNGKIALSRGEYDSADGDLNALKEVAFAKAVAQFGKEIVSE